MTNTTVVKALEITDENTRYDVACKRLLSEKAILARLLKFCLGEFKDFEADEVEKCIELTSQISTTPVMPDEKRPVITGMDTADKKPHESSVYYDILFRVTIT